MDNGNRKANKRRSSFSLGFCIITLVLPTKLTSLRAITLYAILSNHTAVEGATFRGLRCSFGDNRRKKEDKTGTRKVTSPLLKSKWKSGRRK